MSKDTELDKAADRDIVSNCCSAQVYDPSGEGVEGRCKDCGEMCLMMETK